MGVSIQSKSKSDYWPRCFSTTSSWSLMVTLLIFIPLGTADIMSNSRETGGQSLDGQYQKFHFVQDERVKERDTAAQKPSREVYRERRFGRYSSGLQITVMERVKAGDGRRIKRVVPANYTVLWGEKIPYVLDSTFRALGTKKKRTLQRAMDYISDHLCVIFVDETYRYRRGSTTWLPRDKYPDGNFIFIKHSGTVCRADIKLDTTVGQHTVEPCDDFKVNLHEMLHMMRGNHMHQGSSRDRYITINLENVDPFLRISYNKWEQTSQEYFEPFSSLMYGPLTWSMNKLETWTPIRDDIAQSDVTISTSPVEFWELNRMYRCAERFCPPRDCGPGYLARVKGVCTCVCPREYEPLTNCTYHLDGPKENVTWPKAPFSLFSASNGNSSCPDGFDALQTVKFKTLWGGQDWQMKRGPEYFQMPWPWVHMPICTRSKVSKTDWDSWPDGGDFCVIKPKRRYCRADFSEYTVWARAQTRSVYDRNIGDFRFSGYDMTLKMCCRQSVLWGWPLELPNGQAFRLISGGSCPKVDGMREYQMILLLSSSMTPRKWGRGRDHARPWVNIFKDQIQIRTCYYQPPVYGCSMEVMLDEVESSFTWFTPGYQYGMREPNRRCFYNFLVPEGAKVKVTINDLDIQAEDKFYVRRFHKWQMPHPLDKDNYPYEMVSEGSYLALEWWSSYVYYGISNKGVNFTATMIPESSSCYNLTTNGAEYDGDHNYSETWEECLSWSEAADCLDFPADSVDAFWLAQAGNKCRNPGGLLDQPWCYTYKNGSNCHKRYCDVCNYMVPADAITSCAARILEDPDFCNSSISRYGCFKSCNMTQPIYTPITCGAPLIPADGELVGSSERQSYQQGEYVLVRCSNPRDAVISNMKCTAGGWSMLTHACSATYSETCPSGWTHHGTRCFRYYTPWVPRRQAEQTCRSVSSSGSLFRVKTVGDQVMLRRFRFLLGDRSVYVHGMWISGELNATDSKWYFTDSADEMKYFNWTQGAVTNRANQGCVKMTAEYSWAHDAGAWKTLNCDDSRNIAPFVCQMDVADAEVWDRSDQCQDTLTNQPNFCISPGTRLAAALFCAASCGGSHDNVSSECLVPASNMTSGGAVIPGHTVTFSCPQGQFQVGGDTVRACGDNGTLLGEDLQCSDKPSEQHIKLDSLRRRRDSINFNTFYLLDNEAYRVPQRGNISHWYYHCKTYGLLVIAVFNKTSANKYAHVGTNSFRCEPGYKLAHTVPPSDWIAVKPNDVIGVMSPRAHTLSANLCDGAMNEIMISKMATVYNTADVAAITSFTNSTCIVPSLGYTVSP